MIALAVVAVLVLVAAAGFARHGRPVDTAGGTRDVIPDGERSLLRPDGRLEAVLDRAVARGQITRAVADAIVAAESAPVGATPGTPVRRGVSALVEALGYVGAVLVLAGASFLVGQSWDTFGPWTRLGVLGGAAAVLLVVGLLLQNEDEPVIWRLRSFILLLCTGATAGFTGVLVAEHTDWSGSALALAVGAAIAVESGALWQLADRPVQHATTFVGVLVAAGASMSWIDGAGAVGAAMVAIGATWTALGVLDYVPPRYAAVPLGLAATLIGPAVMTESLDKWAPLIGLAIATIVVAIGTLRHTFIFTGPGVVAIMGYLPASVAQWFGDRLDAPAIMLISGVLLLAVMLVLLRRSRGDHPGDRGRPLGGGLHFPHHAGT